MMTLHLSFKTLNILVEPSGFHFTNRHRQRFEWFALMAYRRARDLDKGLVWPTEIARLPAWRGKTRRTLTGVVARYIGELDRHGVQIVEAPRPWAGPYCLKLAPDQILFDLPIDSVRKELEIPESHPFLDRDVLYKFSRSFCRATSLLYEGRLPMAAPGPRKGRKAGAFKYLRTLSADDRLPQQMRLLALLSLVRVQDRMGRIDSVGLDIDEDVPQADTPELKVMLHLARARYLSRMPDRMAEADAELRQARVAVADTVDQGLAGAVADREGRLLLKRGDANEALVKSQEGLWSRLLVGNFERVHVSCFNIGDALYHLGQDGRHEAARWFRLCVDICHWFHLGRDRSLAQTKLAEIAFEEGNVRAGYRWLEKAEEICARSEERANLAEYNEVRRRARNYR